MKVYEWIRKIIIAITELPCYVNSYNDDYDNIVSVHYYDSNNNNEVAFGTTTISRYIDFQVRVRHENHQTGYNLLELIENFFSPYNYEVMNVIPKSQIHMLGNDEKDRSVFTCNFNMELIEGTILSDSPDPEFTYLRDSDSIQLKDSTGNILIL